MSERKIKFDPNSAFKSIIGLEQEISIENVSEHSKKSELIIVAKEKEETKSKRVNFLIKPSVHKKAQEKCEKLGISLNECINQFLEYWSND